MKRWIHLAEQPHKKIVITMNVAEVDQNIAASGDYLTHPKNIKKKFRISDKHLEYLNDIISTFDYNLQAAKFEIIDRRSASNSYSYYITFIPITESGEQLLPIDLVFRVSNHSSKTADGSEASSFARIISFTLQNEDFDKASDLIYEGIRIIRELKKGNTNILDEI